MTKRKKNKRKLNKKRFYSFIILFTFLVFFCYKLFNVNIKNIYIKGNVYFSDQEIIDMAKLKNYPKSMNNLSLSIAKRLEKNSYILKAKVYKRGFINKVYIEVEENYPLFYYKTENKTILYSGEKTTDKFTVPTIINHIPNTIYDEFLKKIKKIDRKILNRISEIEYAPNEVDEERFFLIMNDGNYVYLTLNRFLLINKYINMIKSFNNKKGILYLDSGEYFDIFDE